MSAPSGTAERVVEAARDLIASDGDPKFYAFLKVALDDYDDVVAAERAWVGDWPYGTYTAGGPLSPSDEQAVSFAYGNLKVDGWPGTKDDVRRALRSLRSEARNV